MSLGQAVRFNEIQRVLALFTQGLSGRYLHLKLREAQAAKLRVHAVETDGESIHLPEEIASFESARENLGAYRIEVLHQIGYLEWGTFDFDLDIAAAHLRLTQTRLPEPSPGPESALIRMRLWPAARVSDLDLFFARWPRPGLLRRIFITLEDLRIDASIRRQYPGARADLDRVLAHALAARPRLGTRRPLAGLIEALVQFSLGADRTTLQLDDDAGLLVRILDTAEALLQPAASVYDSARVALDICALLEGMFRKPRAAPEPASTEASGLLEEDRHPASDASVAGDQPGGASADEDQTEADAAEEDIEVPGVPFRGELRTDRAYRRTRGGTPGGVTQEAKSAESDAASTADEETDDGEPGSASAGARAGGPRRPARQGPQSFLYDEWDCHARTYLKAWCRLYEHRLGGEDHAFVGAARRRNAPLANEVKRHFASIRPESWHRVHRASDGDELELDALIDAVIDRRSGHATDEHLYVRRDRGLREVCAAFLVDMSASTDFPIPDPLAPPPPGPDENDLYLWGRTGAPLDTSPSTPKRRVIDVAKDALVLMCDALERLGDSHAVYGFSGNGRENVEFNVIKDFTDRLSARTWAALAAMAPRGSTRMGPAIRHATSKLARQPLRRKVLIIVSDGYPEDRDYGPDRNDREYGILDTARALQEAERAGISTFCITIDPAGSDYLRRMCAEDRYLVIDDVTALPAELSKVYRALTRSAVAARGR